MQHSRVGKKILLAAGKAVFEKKGLELVLFDLRGISDIADYFLICSGTSDRQVRAIADAIEDALLKIGIKMDHKEGYEESTWILLDYGDLVAHIFKEDKRQYYDLERLWGDAPRVNLPSLDSSAKDEQLPA